MNAREVAETGGPVASCPVDLRACLRDICEPEHLGPCMKVSLEIVRRQYLSASGGS